MARAPFRKFGLLLACHALGVSMAIEVDGTCKFGDDCRNDSPKQEDINALFQSKTTQVLMSRTPPENAPDAVADQINASMSPRMQKLDEITSAVTGIISAGATPEFATTIQALIEMITTDLQVKIKEDQSAAQSELDSRIAVLTTKTESAVGEKSLADQFDSSYDQCITEEKQLLEAYETCKAEEAVLIGEVPTSDYCEHADLSWVYSPLQLPETLVPDFTLGLSHVEDQLDLYIVPLKEWIEAQKDQAAIDYGKWDIADKRCKAKITERDEKIAECIQKAETWRVHNTKCLNASSAQKMAMCVFGFAYQAKCEAKTAFDTAKLDITSTGSPWSEPDREHEWRQTTRLVCVLTNFKTTTELKPTSVEDCTKTDAAAEEEFTQDVGRIDQKQAEYNLLTSPANFTCAEADVTFGSGALWTVPENTDEAEGWIPHSTEYTKATGYKYAIDSDSNQPPFEFCLHQSAHTTCGSAFQCGAGSQMPPDTTCVVNGGCTAAACCVKEAACGDHVLDAGETCDDGNTVDGDGCSATCTLELGTITWEQQASTQCGSTDAENAAAIAAAVPMHNQAVNHDSHLHNSHVALQCESATLAACKNKCLAEQFCRGIEFGSNSADEGNGASCCLMFSGHDAGSWSGSCWKFKIDGSIPDITAGSGNSVAAQPSTVALLSTCGATGWHGPEQSACDSAYGDSSVEVTSGYQILTVSETRLYKLTAKGARGGNHGEGFGGYGASVTRTLHLDAGDRLVVVVGQRGWDNPNNADWGSGGGGGSFVGKVVSADGGRDVIPLGLKVELLLAAGGGAGLVDTRNSGQAEGGLSSEGDPLTAAVGGNSGGGGGYTLDGLGGTHPPHAQSFLNGAVGGEVSGQHFGGFGGGGQPYNGGGGGGGYDGGDCNIGGTDNDCHGGSSFGGVATPNENNGDGSVRLMKA